MRCLVSKKQAMKMWLVPLVHTKETKKTDCCSGNKIYTHEGKRGSLIYRFLHKFCMLGGEVCKYLKYVATLGLGSMLVHFGSMRIVYHFVLR